MKYKRYILELKCLLFFMMMAFCFMTFKCNAQAKEQTLTGTLYWGTNPYNGFNIIGNKCAYEVNSGDTLILDGADAYGDLSSSANNGIKVNEGGTLIVRNTRFHDAHAIHIVMNGGTLYLYSGSSTPECYEFCAGKGTVYIYDGTWEANRHNYGGEGVFYMYPRSEIHMEGGRIGSITQPSATSTSYVTQHGIYAYGATVYMSGGTIENCLIGIWARSIYMSGGTIKNCNSNALNNKGNSYSFTIAAGVVSLYGDSEFTGGKVENNYYGILNQSNMLLDGTVVQNNQYGIYHADEYLRQKSQVGQNALAGVYVNYEDYHVYDGGITADSTGTRYNHAGIVLGEDRFICVSGEIADENTRIGSVFVMPESRRLGYVVAVTDYDRSLEYTEYVKPMLELAFDSWEFRSGVGTNSDIGNLILSKEAEVRYSKNFLMEGFEVRMKNDADTEIVMNSDHLFTKGYWREACSISKNIPVIYRDDQVISNMYFSHWNTSVNDDGQSIAAGGSIPGEYVEDVVMIYAFYDIMPDIFYRGNGQTSGDDYIRHYELGEPYILDESIFSKDGYSHQGWGSVNSLTYSDEGVYKAGEILDIRRATDWAIDNGEYTVSEDGNISINIYSVWDKIPELSTKDIVVLKGRVEDISFEKIYENISANDKEDGELSPINEEKEIGYSISNYDNEEELKDEIDILPDGGAVMVVVVAKDGAKNTVTDSFWIYVNSNEPSDDQVACYVRSISRAAYDTHSNDQGGCLEKSKWYEKDVCVQSINTAFDSLESKVSEETYVLGQETRLSAIEWIINRGFSKTKTDSAIKDWGRTLDKT